MNQIPLVEFAIPADTLEQKWNEDRVILFARRAQRRAEISPRNPRRGLAASAFRR